MATAGHPTALLAASRVRPQVAATGLVDATGLVAAAGLLDDPTSPVDRLDVAGYTVAVATDHAKPPLASWLEAAGARTVVIRAVRTIPQPDPDGIARAVEECLAAAAHEVIVSSAFGLRAWLDAARRLGRLDGLVDRLRGARLLARDPTTADGLRELGLTQIWSTATGTTEDLFRYLLGQPMVGRRVVAQLETDGQRELTQALRAAGADVVEVATTQSAAPIQVDGLRRLCDLVIRRQVDAVSFAGPVAVENLLARATADRTLDPLLNTLLDNVTAVCLGPLTAAPLLARGVPCRLAEPATPPGLALTTLAELAGRAVVVQIADRRVELRGQAIVIDGQLVPVQSGPLAVLRVLVAQPGRVLSPAQIRAAIPSSAVDDHAIEMAVSRLRHTLGRLDFDGSQVIQTVMKRGYRLDM